MILFCGNGDRHRKRGETGTGKRGQAQFLHDMMHVWRDPLALTSETFRITS